MPLFLIMILLVVIIGVVGNYSLRQTKYWWEKAEKGGLTIASLGDELKIDLLEARRAEKDFLLRYSTIGPSVAKEKYITKEFSKHLELLHIALSKISAIEALQGETEDVEKLKKFKGLMDKYSSGVMKVTDLVLKKGFKDEGLIGAYRKSIKLLESSIKEDLKKKTNLQSDMTDNDEHIMISLLTCRRLEKDFLLREDIKYITSFKDEINNLIKLLEKSRLLSANKKKLVSLAEDYKTKFLKVNEITGEIRQAINDYREPAHNIEAQTSEITEEGHRMARNDIGSALSIGEISSQVLIYGIIITVIIGLLISYFITNIIKKPIIKLVDVTRQISRDKDLSVPIEVNRKDEIGDLAKSFKEMLETMREQVVEMAAGATQLSTSINEISASTVQLSAGTTETSTSITQITTTVEEVRQTSQSAHEKATEVAEKAESITNTADEGITATNSTIEGINKINEEMEYIAQATIKLGEQTQNIGDIINTVNGLADQSNLLSVNASIEAAKAGEYGKGFAVVAREVKSLADLSKDATKQIGTILTDIQKAASTAVLATERGSKAVKEGLDLSSVSGNAINILAENIKESAEASIQIAAASQQQVSGMDQLAATMENIKDALDQNVSATKELEQHAQSINGLGQKLQSMSSQFKTKGGHKEE